LGFSKNPKIQACSKGVILNLFQDLVVKDKRLDPETSSGWHS